MIGLTMIPKILAVCLIGVVAGCLIAAIQDPSFQLIGGFARDESLKNVAFWHPLSLLYQNRLPPVSVEKAFVGVSHAAIPPVQVLVCVEALCIDSQRFFHDQLMIAFNALGHDVMNLTVVSFGNAKLPSDGSRNITCQHGYGECDTNAYEQCAIHLYPDPAIHVPYLACLFAALPMGHRDNPFEPWMGLEPCAHEHHLDFEKIKQCHSDADLVWELQQASAGATPKRHDHVPWTEINGQYMDEEAKNLLQEVCKVYKQAGGHTAGCSAIL